ncbi:hypothetical protein [Streptomyces sp. NPDC001492]
MLEGIDDGMKKTIIEELALDVDHLGDALNNSATLDWITDDLGRVNLAARLEQMYGVDDVAFDKWVTVQDVIDTIHSLQTR